MFKKGLIITNAFITYVPVRNMVERLISEFKKVNIEIDNRSNVEILTYIDSNGNIQTKDLPYDFIIYLDKDYYIAKMLEKGGYRLFNKPEALKLCDDKILTHIALANHDIKMPKTIAFPLQYVDTSKDEFIKNLLTQLDFPFVVKESYGSLGAQVHLVNNYDELLKLENEIGSRPHLYQELITSSIGMDTRVIVVGHQVVASMKRQAQTPGEFRSNIELGGVGSCPELPANFKEVAEKISVLLDLDYCGLDLLFGPNNEPILCEVNANAFISGIEKYSHVNVAESYVKYIVSQVYD